MISHDRFLKEVPPASIFEDRRQHGRCSIELPVLFEAVDGPAAQMGTGTVVNISSTGIAFKTTDTIPCGCYVNVAVSWPYPVAAPTTLMAYGRVVRKSGEMMAIRVLRRKFQRQTSDTWQMREAVPEAFQTVPANRFAVHCQNPAHPEPTGTLPGPHCSKMQVFVVPRDEPDPVGPPESMPVSRTMHDRYC
jgi:hypothetical protein